MHWAAMQGTKNCTFELAYSILFHKFMELFLGHGEVIKHLIENNYKDQVESYDSGFFTPFNYGVIYSKLLFVIILCLNMHFSIRSIG